MPSRESSIRNGKKGGRPLGRKNDDTLKKEVVMKAYQQRVMSVADRLLDIQLGLAHGSTYLFKIEKELVGPKKKQWYRAKKPVLVTDLEEIQMYLEGKVENGDMEDSADSGTTYYYMTTKEPDRQAAEDILNRTFGRSTASVTMDVTSDGEKLQLFNETQLQRIASRLSNGRKPVKK